MTQFVIIFTFYRSDPKKDDKPNVSYSIFSYLENPVHDKESFAKEQTKFSGSKSMNEIRQQGSNIVSATKVIPKAPVTTNTSIINTPSDVTKISSDNITATGFNKRLTVAELFLKESVKDLQDKNKGVITDTIDKFDKMDLYKSIFLSDSENEEEIPKIYDKKDKVIDFDDLLNVPKNVERNTSPPRGIFANIDFDELNSWKRNANDEPTEAKSTDGKVPAAHKDNNVQNQNEEKGHHSINEIQNDGAVQPDAAVYGPKIPENLQKRIENPLDNFKPVFRSKAKNDDVVEVSSNSSGSWVDAKEVSKINKKKKKKHKSKHKKSKHKKKER